MMGAVLYQINKYSQRIAIVPNLIHLDSFAVITRRTYSRLVGELCEQKGSRGDSLR
jgi:hypothetical protein